MNNINGSDLSTNEALARTCAELRAAGLDGAILASVANVTYVTNIEVPVPAGALPELTYGPWLAVIAAREEVGWVVVPAFAAACVEEDAPRFSPLPFATLESFAASDPRASYLSQVDIAVTQAGLHSHRAAIGVESRAVPAMVQERLMSNFSSATYTEAEDLLVRARWTKTEREIGLLKNAAHLADVAHNSLKEQCNRPGLNEIDMWTTLSAAVFLDAGRDLLLTGELVTGPRTSTVLYPNGPHNRLTAEGDAALLDLSGRLDGYWFDCTNTHIVGGVEPTQDQHQFARASQAACEAAMESLRPGNRASDAASAAKRAFTSFGLPMAHYAGHQIGASVNELPRLVPYDHSVIEAGMVFSVEPGAYQGPDGTFGARSEKMVLVKESGPEILSTFAWGI